MYLIRPVLISFILLLIRGSLSLRYRLTIKGKEELKQFHQQHSGGFLFLPNHPAEIDPVIIMAILGGRFCPRPLVIEHFYYAKGLMFFMKLVRALPVPDSIASANQWKLKQIEKLNKKVAEQLEKGENFLVYPAGRLKVDAREVIGGASLAYYLINACPKANIVLIRTSGLWGSRFSRALTGQAPPFGKMLYEGFKILLKNGIFFAPRRDVSIEIKPISEPFFELGTKVEFNRFLEQWYNQYPDSGPEPLKLVSSSFWKQDLPIVNLPEADQVRMQEVHISPEIEKNIIKEVAQLSHRQPSDVKRPMHLSVDLGLDSLDVAQLYVYLDEHFDIESLPQGGLQTVEDLLRVASGKKMGGKEFKQDEKLDIWPHEYRRRVPFQPEGKTLPEAFLIAAQRMGGGIACSDFVSGMLSYRRLKKSVVVLALKLREIPGDKVGVLLPSSVAVNVLILAILLAKKIPVMLNWTVGVRALNYAVDLLKFPHVISSYRFLSRLENGDIGHLEDRLILMEEFKETISLKDKLKGLWLSFKSPKKLLAAFEADQLNAEDIAGILFTSGTETLPKAVPLTHANLLTNQRDALSSFKLKSSDVLLSILPPFHSFGFSVTGLLPLLSGLRVCYVPDPTDSQSIVRACSHWHPTLFCSAPSFIKSLFQVARQDQLQSLRLIVSAAEKTPEELFIKWRNYGKDKVMLEGYGITECGPIVSVNREGEPHRGVGRPLPSVQFCVIDPETQRPLNIKEEGEVCICGPNVFSGYIGSSSNPFVSIDGKSWYKSGDRGFLDENGYLYLCGRLKRFIKIGGEMVSLTGLEEELTRLSKINHWLKPVSTQEFEGPLIAISVREKNGDKPLIILFTVLDVTREEVNAALKECGYGKIIKIAEVKKVEQIPLTGTGKTHYRLLDEMSS